MINVKCRWRLEIRSYLVGNLIISNVAVSYVNGTVKQELVIAL